MDEMDFNFSMGRRVKLVNGKKLQIALLDDHPVVMLGSSALMNAQPDMTVIASVTHALELTQRLQEVPCDVVVTDFFLPRQPLDGAQLLRRLRAKNPDLTIIVLSGGDPLELEYASFRAGANAFLSKKSKPAALIDIVRQTREYPQQFFVLRDGLPSAFTPERRDNALTVGEIEVLRQLANGLTVAQVARQSHRSKQTISTHKRRAMAKLKLNDDLSLALFLNQRFTQ